MNIALMLSILASATFLVSLKTGALTWPGDTSLLEPALILLILSFCLSIASFATLVCLFPRKNDMPPHPLKFLLSTVLAAIPPVAFVFLMKF